MTQRRDASALLTGCHEPWRRQHPESALLTRPDWQRLLPLVAQVQAQRPDVTLPAVLTDRVASARSLPGVLAWRLWRLLKASPLSDTAPQSLTPRTDRPSDEDATDYQQHLPAVRALGGPAAVRAALRAATVTSPSHHTHTGRTTRESTHRRVVRAYGAYGRTDDHTDDHTDDRTEMSHKHIRHRQLMQYHPSRCPHFFPALDKVRAFLA